MGKNKLTKQQKRQRQKDRKAKRRAQNQPVVWSADRRLCSLDMDCGIVMHMRKPRASVTQALIASTPVIHEWMGFAQALARMSLEEVDKPVFTVPETMSIPGEEMELVYAYLAKHAVDLENFESDIEWSDMSLEMRADVIDTHANPSELWSLFGEFLASVIADGNAKLRGALNE